MQKKLKRRKKNVDPFLSEGPDAYIDLTILIENFRPGTDFLHQNEDNLQINVDIDLTEKNLIA